MPCVRFSSLPPSCSWSAAMLARYADQAVGEHPRRRRRRCSRPNSRGSPRPASTSMELSSGRDGHFQVDARVDGRQIDFMVDTGASLVICAKPTPPRLGIHPCRATTPRSSPTANGTIKAAPAKLDRIEVGGITVCDVPALVLPDEALCAEPARHLVPVAAASATNTPTAAWCSSSKFAVRFPPIDVERTALRAFRRWGIELALPAPVSRT